MVEKLFNLFISNNVDAILSGNEIRTRCRWCGDSQRDHKKKRLYIGEKDGILLAHCFNCDTSTRVNETFIKMFINNSLESTALLQELNSKKFFNLNSSYKRNFVQVLKVPLPMELKNEYNNKMFYFEHRTGLHPIENQQKYRIIYSLKSFMYQNQDRDLSKLRSYKEYFLDKLDEKYIGFLDATHTRIVFRVLPEFEQEEQRIFSLQVSNKVGNDVISYYHSVGKLEINNLELNFTEGIFDCINLETKYKDKPNQLFIAVMSKDYTSKVIEIYRTYGLYISKLNFYLDKDHNTYFQFKEIINKKFSTFYKNTIDKDFGEITKPFKPYVVNKVIEMIPSLNDKSNWKKR